MSERPRPQKAGWQTWKSTHARKFDFVEAIYRAMIAVNIGLGVAIIVGGPTRFPFPTYKPLLDLSNGSVVPWGVSVLGAGVLMALDSWYLNLIGLGVSLLWMNVFSAMFFISYKYSTSASTDPIPYIGLAMITVALLTNKIITWRTRVYNELAEKDKDEVV